MEDTTTTPTSTSTVPAAPAPSPSGKKLWASKTFWVNVLACLAFGLQYLHGYVLAPEAQTSLLAAVNIVLRVVTHEEIVWG